MCVVNFQISCQKGSFGEWDFDENRKYDENIANLASGTVRIPNLAKIRQSLVENLNQITKENPCKVDGNCESDKNGESGW